MNIVENIIKIRKEKSISQEVIALALNVDTSVVSNIENKKRELRTSELEKIAKVLDVDVLYLLTYPQIYVPKEPKKQPELPETILQIKLSGERQKKILTDIFGKANLEFL
jgi:transcriptional regulator with XRE-family HTH domain